MHPGSWKAGRATGMVALLLIASILGALSPGPMATAQAGDDAVVLVEAFQSREGLEGNVTLYPVTGADGVDYHLFTVRLLTHDGGGAWTPETITPDDVLLLVRGADGEGASTRAWGGAANAFAFAGDDTRVLVTVPADAAPDGVAILEARVGDHVGMFNPLKSRVDPAEADDLDAAPTPVVFRPETRGTWSFGVTLEIHATPGDDASAPTGYDIVVTPLGPVVEETVLTVRDAGGNTTTQNLTLDASAPVTTSFAGDPEGVIVATEGTRFSTASRHTYGDPVARFILCRADTPCAKSITKVATVTEVEGDARGSYSPVEEAISHEWDFDDGTFKRNALVYHEWQDPGVYKVNLTVTDAKGRSDNVSVSVEVLNRAPTGVIEIQTAEPNRNTNLDAMVIAHDADGIITEYTWYLDGEPTPHDRGLNTLSVPGEDLTLGEHELRVVFRDDQGAVGVAEATFDVVNLVPIVMGASNKTYVRPGVPIQFYDKTFELDGHIVNRVWAFGDGATSNAEKPEHAYAEEGRYDVRLTIEDNDGAVESKVVRNIVVDATAPEVTYTVPPVPESGWYTTPPWFRVDATDNLDLVPLVRVSTEGKLTHGTRSVNLVLGDSGVYNMKVTARDAAYNWADEQVKQMPVDLNDPRILFEPPYPFATGTERLVIDGEDDTSGVARITFAIDGETHTVHEGAGPLMVDWDTTEHAPGYHTLGVTIEDVAGHVAHREYEVLVLGLPGFNPSGLP